MNTLTVKDLEYTVELDKDSAAAITGGIGSGLGSLRFGFQGNDTARFKQIAQEIEDATIEEEVAEASAYVSLAIVGSAI